MQWKCIDELWELDAARPPSMTRAVSGRARFLQPADSCKQDQNFWSVVLELDIMFRRENQLFVPEI